MLLLKKRKLNKIVALFLLFNILNQLFAPTIVYALTAGPTSPDSGSFEPIDTTDMVNPFTGSFTYNIPAIEIPGPEGSYPLSLSYHAGAQTNEESSWVGLGWTLNPGAISRNVNGYPDDWEGDYGVTRTYWQGGTTKTVGVDVGLGFGPASVNFGLSFAQDTYKGFATGVTAGIGNAFGFGDPISLGIQVTVEPFGGTYANFGVQEHAGPLEGDMGVNTNFKSLSTDASLTLGNSFLGTTLSSSGLKSTLGGYTGEGTVKGISAGKISTSTKGFSISIPIGSISVGLQYQYERYWSDETDNTVINGALYPSKSGVHVDFNNTADDSYNLLDYDNSDIIDNPDPLKQVGGTFPEFDDYMVTAQGLSGAIRPYVFQAVLFNQSVDPNTGVVGIIHPNEPVSSQNNLQEEAGMQFRFIDDFSNSSTQYSSPNPPFFLDEGYSFDQLNNSNGDKKGYDPATNRLEGSRHIEYFTNAEIIAERQQTGRAYQLGFVDCSAPGLFRQNDQTIGGFMITNANGVTYHYALPAMSSGEFIHTESLNKSSGDNFNDQTKTPPYAYTWYLTAITGPDYVDRGTPGLDNSDYGYWVKFDYGRWVSDYNWRNPSEGATRDIDNGFQEYSTGEKEVYYLDAIETRSHTAIFEKQLRADGKSQTGAYGSNVPNSGIYVPTNNPCATNTSLNSYVLPRPTLCLKNIYLFQNDQLPMTIDQIRQNSTNYDYQFSYNSGVSGCSANQIVSSGQNVIDSYDITPLLVSKCLRKVAFNYDYSLCPGVPNSYDPDGTSTYTQTPIAPTNLLGKLTLLSVDFQGSGGQLVTPPISFQYDLDPTSPANLQSLTIAQAPENVAGTNQKGSIIVTSNNIFKAGDIVSFPFSGKTYYLTVLTLPDINRECQVLYLNNSPGSSAVNTIVFGTKTKNPPYNKDDYDQWGSYKSDYTTDNPSGPNINENACRLTTSISNCSVDAWSLRKITTSIGNVININYEGNQYSRSVLTSNQSLIINNCTRLGQGLYTVTVSPPPASLDVLYKIGAKVSFQLLKETNTNGSCLLGTKNYTPPPGYVQASTYALYSAVSSNDYSSSATISSINSSQNQLTISVSNALDAAIQYNVLSNCSLSTVTAGVGNIQYNPGVNYGGGVRTASINIDDLNGGIHQTSYNYNVPGSSGVSSGVTSYEPAVFPYDPVAPGPIQNMYRIKLYAKINKLLAISREVPPPGVTYEYVTETYNQLLPNGTPVSSGGSTSYQYEVFNPGMIGIKEYSYQSILLNQQTSYYNWQSNSNSTEYVANKIRRNIAIKNYTSRIGDLKRMVSYDNNGNKISEKINHYLYDDLDGQSLDQQILNYEPRLLSYNNIGVIQERFGSSRILSVSSDGINTYYNEFLVMATHESYPSIQTGVTQIDYKNGTNISQTNLAFDYYTGEVTKTLYTDSYGNRFIHQITPAYTLPAYEPMGLKTYDGDAGVGIHKQMLTQEASDYTFNVDSKNSPIGVVTATVQTWGNEGTVLDPNGQYTTEGQSNIWRANSTYLWSPGGNTNNIIQPYNTFVDYYDVNNSGSSNPSWVQTGQVTTYDVYSHALESSDINSNFFSSKMGYNNSKVVVSGYPARYNELAYFSFDDGNYGSAGSSQINTNPAISHTGSNSLLLNSNSGNIDISRTYAIAKAGSMTTSPSAVPPGPNVFSYTVPLTSLSNSSEGYAVSVWVYAGTALNQAQLFYQIGNAPAVYPTMNLSKTTGNWCLLEMTIPAADITAGNRTGNLQVGFIDNAVANGFYQGNMYIDDFRFQPLASKVSAFVYDAATGQLNYVLDKNNLYTRFEYDAIGRITRISREVLGQSNAALVKTLSYNYGSFTGN